MPAGWHYNYCSKPMEPHWMRQKRHCGATTRRGTPCQCKAIETKRGAWRCKLRGGKSTGPTSAEGRARIAAAARARHARARGNPLVSIIVTADAFLPLNAAGRTIGRQRAKPAKSRATLP
jgi:hypothetical protein